VTALICHDNIGSLSNVVDLVEQLHPLGINVFAFDYRGFGQSDWARPSERRIYQDSDAALYYLEGTRHIGTNDIVLYGVGAGAAACAHAAQGRNAAALVLQNPLASMLPIALSENRTRVVPLRLLFHEKLELMPLLRELDRPKLFIAAAALAEQGSAQAYAKNVRDIFVSAREPKMYWEESPGGTAASEQFRSVLYRFLDEYVPAK
jgi:pimeloyl-ACP methyl ester carboxylesterase